MPRGRAFLLALGLLLGSAPGPVWSQTAITLPLPTVRGQVTLEPLDGQTRVTVAAQGFEPGTSHGVLIRRGRCAQGEAQDFGDVVAEVMTVQADAQGRASGTAVLSRPLATLADGRHMVTIGFGPGRSRGIDCADLPALALPRTGQPAPTGLALTGLGLGLLGWLAARHRPAPRSDRARRVVRALPDGGAYGARTRMSAGPARGRSGG